MIREDINYKVERITTLQGNPGAILYIDPQTSEDIFPHKDILNKYGAKWDSRKRRWYWYVSLDKDKRQIQMDKYINPCIRELNAVENSGNPVHTEDETVNAVHTLISELDKIINAKIETTEKFTPEDAKAVKAKLLEFKKQLINCTTNEEFRQRFEPILKQVIEGGRVFSILNTILIRIQDPEASYVYSKGKWNSLNRYVDTAHAKPICMWAPIQDPKEVKKFIKEWKLEHGKQPNEELTPDEENEMFDEMKDAVKANGWRLSPNFYDIRFTKVKRGKKDLTTFKSNGQKLVNTKNGNENGDLQWFDENTPVTEESEKIYKAVIKTIEDLGIRLSYVDNLGGARGVSKGGYIEVLKDAPKNIGTCNTLIHELAHEFFHHKDLQGIDKKWGKYYLGRAEGRPGVEQQAELCAWIVMRFLGYDMQTNVNYMGNWGINEENCVAIFDQVASAADKIASLLFAELDKENATAEQQEQPINESILREEITGLQVASMLGDKYKELYLKSKQRMEDTLEETKMNINEAFKRICGTEIL